MDYNKKCDILLEELSNERYYTTIKCAESLILKNSEKELNKFFKISRITDKEIRLLVIAVALLKDYPSYFLSFTGDDYFKSVSKEIDKLVIDDLYNEIFCKAKTIDDCHELYKLGFDTELGSCFAEIYESDNCMVESILKAVKLGFDLNLTKNNGETILTSIVVQGNLSAAEFILNNGADIKKQNNKGETALAIAIKNNDLQMIRMLISKGAIKKDKDYLVLSNLNDENKKKLKAYYPELCSKFEIIYRLQHYHN